MRKLIAILSLFLLLSNSLFASARVSKVLEIDREARFIEINKKVDQINKAEMELVNFQYELSRTEAENTKLRHEVFMRNVARVLAAVGFCTTLLYQKKFITPGAFMLVGGYSLSGISAIIMAIEQDGIRLNNMEINDLKASIGHLENLIEVEKKNLEKEKIALNS